MDAESVPADQRIKVEDYGDGAQRIIFERSYFEAFNVLTAIDIIERIPGAQINGTGGARGLGAQGNVLVDGERVSGKSNDARDTLSRIPAVSVARIELIRGIVPGIDVRGGGQIINVVLKADRQRITGTWEWQNRYLSDRNLRFGFDGTANLDFDRVDALIGFRISPFSQRQRGPERLTDGSGDISELREENYEYARTERELTGNFSIKMPEGQSLKINALLSYLTFDEFEESARFSPQSILREDRRFDTGRNTPSIELGIDYERQLTDKLSWQSIAIQTLTYEDEATVDSQIPVAGVETGSTLDVQTDTGETVLRNTLDWQAMKGHTFRFGLEGAYNFLESTTRVAEDNGDGLGLQQVSLANSNERVTEYRGEAFVTHTWQIDPTATLDTLVAWEYSNIRQAGDDAQSRTFNFLKPELTFTKNFTKADQVRLQVRRRVSQLDFNDFVSTVDIRDETLATGNPELSPPQRTRLQLTYEHRWPNDVARIRVRPFYLFLEDVIDLVPIGTTDDAPGNIGSGERYGFEIEASSRLDDIGIAGGFVSGEIELGNSRVTDPLTGENRQISGFNQVRYRVEYRQDITKWGLAYGFRIDNFSPETDFETNEIDRTNQSFNSRWFIEYATPWGLVIDGGVLNPFGRSYSRDRTLFVTNRVDGDILNNEVRRRTELPAFFFNVRGTF